jgi:hyperosmotically inducible periplasmic protein
MPTHFPPSPSSLTHRLALAAGLAFFAAGCSPKADGVAAPTVPATTVGMEIDDTVVTTRVKTALIEHNDTKGFDIKVETRKGLVQLSGFVDNRSQADRAIAVAKGVEGVKGITDAMTLKEGQVSVGNAVDDTVVTARVKTALLSDPEVKSAEIAVVTRKGEVQLSGFVATQRQIDHAVAVTRAVEGVQGVLNQIALQK